MKRRTRLIAGLFALIAMTLSVAETVWASTCAPGDMAMGVTAAQEALPGHDGMPMPDGGESRDTPEQERQCPFGPAATAQGCAGVASLPAHATATPAPSPEDAVGVFSEETQHDHLSDDALFHPPRA